jgi:hypothetical protein
LASQVDAESRQRVSWEERWGREDRGGKRKVGVLEEERKEETRKEDPPSDGREERGGNPDAERVLWEVKERRKRRSWTRRADAIWDSRDFLSRITRAKHFVDAVSER